MGVCYRNQEHQNPTDAKFCVRCGTPLRQRCPYQADHWVDVVSEAEMEPRRCQGCRQFLRPCQDCRRLHRLGDHQCRTGTCKGKALPPLRCDWPGFAGGGARRGSFSLQRLPAVGPDSLRMGEYEFPGHRATAISAFGLLYVALDHELTMPDLQKSRTAWPSLDLRSPIPAVASSALLAGEASLYLLTERSAQAATPDALGRIAQIPGQFTQQAVWNGQWLLFGTREGEHRPELLALPEERVTAAPTRLWRGEAGAEAPSVPLVSIGGRVYGSLGSDLLQLDDEGVSTVARAPGRIMAAAGADNGAPFPFLCYLSRQETQYRLHLLNSANPTRETQLNLEGLKVLDRLWTVGPYVLAARNGSHSITPAVLRYDLREPGRAAEVMSWPPGMHLLDAVFLDTPEGLWVNLALCDPHQKVVTYTRQSWSTQGSIPLGNGIGVQQVELLPHANTLISIERSILGARPSVTWRMFKL